MNPFTFRDGALNAEQVPVAAIAAAYGTPCYIYSRAALEAALDDYQQALADCPHLICYAVKANSNLGVLDVLARKGAGFDIVSGGELERVLAAGGDPSKIVFSGVGKTPAEMQRALELGIHCFRCRCYQPRQRCRTDQLHLVQGRPTVGIRGTGGPLPSRGH